jgi:PTS system cellobiose-specific IIA component
MSIDDLNQAGMQIICHAGDARTQIMKALDCVSDSAFEEARGLTAEARKLIAKAHGIQTDVITFFLEKEPVYSFIFNHAQDTLMTIMTEINLVEKLIGVFAKFEGKRQIDESIG